MTSHTIDMLWRTAQDTFSQRWSPDRALAHLTPHKHEYEDETIETFLVLPLT